MKKEFVIEKRITDKVIDYKEIKNKNCYLNLNLKKIIKDIFNLDREIEIKKSKDYDIVYINDEIFCTFSIDDNCMLYKYLIKIVKDNIIYIYDIIEDPKNMFGKFKTCSFKKEDTKYIVERYYSKYLIDIKGEKKGICMAFGSNVDNISTIIQLLSNIEVYDKIETIYKKIIDNSNINTDLTIKKYNILNTVDSRQIDTDLIIIENGKLINFLSIVEKENKKYIIKKERDNYSVTLLNNSLNGLLSSCFDMTEQFNFIKKLEKK